MELFLWDDYEDGVINDKIKYWIDIWGELIGNLNLNSYGLSLINPQTIVNDIIDEIVSNKMRNKENKSYFLKQINRFLDEDEIIKRIYEIEFKVIRDYLNSDKNEYLISVCKRIREFFTEGSYLKETYKLLKSILLSKEVTDSSYERILCLSQSLIVELMLKGFDLKNIKQMPVNIFKKYILHGKYIITDYPHNLDIGEFESEDDYTNSIKNKMDNLSVEERLTDFENYFEKESVDMLVIFQIEGLIAYEGFTCGEVHFYSPRVDKYISQPEEAKDREIFFREDEHIFNAAVWVNAIDDRVARYTAINKIEKAFDLLRCFYKSKVDFKVVKDDCLILDEEFQLRASGGYESGIHERLKVQYSVNMSEVYIGEEYQLIFEKVGSYLYRNQEKQSFIEKKIVDSLHWFRKGEESIKAEDKLLNYWVAIENLMDFKDFTEEGRQLILNKEKETTYTLAKELIPCIEIMSYKNGICAELFQYIGNLVNNEVFSFKEKSARRAIELPEEIKKKCGLKVEEGEFIRLDDFVENLDELNTYTDCRVIKDRITYVDKFYGQNKFALKVIEERIKQIQDDILYIYRYRNKIVHNAHYDNTLLPHYVAKVKEYSNRLLVQVLYEHSKDYNVNLRDMFLKWHLNQSIFIKKLKENRDINVLNYRFN
ncbi:hypothetical protein DFP93_11688 [Aneurinibacillus soli]|uniref:Uncharacterized protein n=1 Tax=Aneurinibacillus soli TaxID=1500254 RepID=A0A0U5B795_9BACL|nr:hypothetical protein [Aneurinibacillus soli]PYE59720.1 hypothetical protein DFP93_11688 [Aneurinibacillus soli]BAU29279.1 hypothetical protein CB4_03466 [Aneurinibacillus soli]